MNNWQSAKQYKKYDITFVYYRVGGKVKRPIQMENLTLTYLDQIRHNLDYADYDIICKSIADLKDKFVPTALLKKGWYIDRVRINRENEIFSNIEQVSYIHDKDVLEKFVTFGRANEPKQAVFYGAVVSQEIQQPRVVAYFETSDLLKELDKFENVEEIFTLSRWEILEDIEIIEMIFSDEALKVNEYNKLSLKNQLKNYGHLPLAEHIEKQGKFFSNEFARNDIKKGESFKYKISASYANYIWNNTHLKGITYPSVQFNYLGQNVALLPKLVDKYLKLQKVGMFKCKKENGKNLTVACFKLATDLGENSMDFKWFDYFGTE